MFVYIFVSLQVVEMKCRELCAIVYTYAHFTYLSSKLANLVHIWRDLGQGWLYVAVHRLQYLVSSILTLIDVSTLILYNILRRFLLAFCNHHAGLINLSRSCFNRF